MPAGSLRHFWVFIKHFLFCQCDDEKHISLLVLICSFKLWVRLAVFQVLWSLGFAQCVKVTAEARRERKCMFVVSCESQNQKEGTQTLLPEGPGWRSVFTNECNLNGGPS